MLIGLGAVILRNTSSTCSNENPRTYCNISCNSEIRNTSSNDNNNNEILSSYPGMPGTREITNIRELKDYVPNLRDTKYYGDAAKFYLDEEGVTRCPQGPDGPMGPYGRPGIPGVPGPRLNQQGIPGPAGPWGSEGPAFILNRL